jgi:hypothetical protein
MAAVPNMIAETLEVAVSSSEPVAAAKPRKPKNAGPKAVPAATAEVTPPAPVAEIKPTVSAKPTEAKQAGKAADVSGPKEGGDGKAYRTPWYVERTDRALRQRASQSFVFLTKKLTLNTHHAQEILERSVEDWSAAMITLSETMRNFKREEDCVVVDAEADRQLDACFESVKASVARLKKMAEAHGLDMDDVEIEYSMPTTHSLRVQSPREMRFHTLVSELDGLCTLTDKMWLVKLLTDRDRSQIPYTTKRQIIGMVNRVKTLVFRAQASTQRAAAKDATSKPQAANDATAAASEAPADAKPAATAQPTVQAELAVA